MSTVLVDLSKATWQEGLEAQYPRFEHWLAIRLRRRDDREEAIADCVARVVVSYQRRFKNGQGGRIRLKWAVCHYVRGDRVGRPFTTRRNTPPFKNLKPGEARARPVDAGGERRHLAEVLERFPTRTRVLVECVLEGWDRTDVARQLGMRNHHTARSLLRVIQRLQERGQ